MEPLLPDSQENILAELTKEITFHAGCLSGSRIPQKTKEGIEKVVQQMNSYYSNLIEGHKTSPLEVEKALNQHFDKDPKKKELQQLGVAHIETEEIIKRRLKDEPTVNIWSSDFLKMIHREFYRRMSPELRAIKSSSGKEYPLIPGEFRTYNVDVARHVPPDYPCIETFITRLL
jgi:Fic family protein